MNHFTEATIGHAAIDWLQELGYSYAFGHQIVFDGVVCTLEILRDSLLLKLMKGEVRVRRMVKAEG